jgi:IS5 family transposase
LATRDLERLVVDTAVQPKAIAHPTVARLCHRALEKLVELAKSYGVPLRQKLSLRGEAGGNHGRALHPRSPVRAGAA